MPEITTEIEEQLAARRKAAEAAERRVKSHESGSEKRVHFF
jgi:hypothetical protein